MRVIIIGNSNIKGYHYFKIRPHREIETTVEKEIDNSYDPNVMIVRMPKLTEISLEMHDQVTIEAKCKVPKQCVKDIASKIVGRVPANVGKLFLKVLRDEYVDKITCRSVELPTLSRVPPPQRSFMRNETGYDRRGGGAVIRCKYVLRCYNGTYDTVYKYLTDALDELSFQGEEIVENSNESPFSCPF